MTEPFAEAAAGPIVFAYAFPHKKTQDMILRLTGLGQRPAAVLAAPHVPLGGAEGVRVRPRHADLVEPEELCRGLGIEYHVVPHESDTCLHVLDLFTLDLGVIAGARILPSAVIERFPLGILNFHPGLLPEVRGLDALQWALYHGHSLGVTAHLIDARVDAGRIVERRIIDRYPDDTLVELGLRLYETQLDMLGNAICRVRETDASGFDQVGRGSYNSRFPPELLPELSARLEQR